MLVVIGFVFIIALFIALAFFKSFYSTIERLAITMISLIVALILHSTVANLIANNSEFLKIDEHVPLLLGSELVYYKVTGFIVVYVLTFVILSIIMKMIDLESKFDIEEDGIMYKVVKIFAGFVTGYIVATIMLGAFLSSPYGYKFANEPAYTISRIPGIGTVNSYVMYDYRDIINVQEENPDLTQDQINIILIESMIEDNYTSKEEIRTILNDSTWMSDELRDWLNE